MVTRFVVILITILALPSLRALADESSSDLFQSSKTTRVLGKDMGGSFTAGTLSDTQQVQSTSTISVLGKTMVPLQTYINPPMTVDGVTYAEFYSFGKRVFSTQYYYSHEGILSFQGGILPTEVRVPLVHYPVGPLVLGIDGGARFQANAEGRLTPTIMFPASLSTLETKLGGNITASGFVEGSAKLFIVRIGVGGELTLVDAHGEVDSLFFFDGRHSITRLGMMASFLRGKIFSFIDFFSIFQWGWARASENDFYKTQGFCFSKGDLACPAN